MEGGHIGGEQVQYVRFTVIRSTKRARYVAAIATSAAQPGGATR